MRRHLTTAALAALVISGFALLVALLMPATAGAVVQTQAPSAAPQVAAPALPPAAGASATEEPSAFLTALVGPATDLTAAQAGDLLAAADRVCEGAAAGVPVMDMADALAGELALTDEEARHLVNTAATVHCR